MPRTDALHEHQALVPTQRLSGSAVRDSPPLRRKDAERDQRINWRMLIGSTWLSSSQQRMSAIAQWQSTLVVS